MQHRYHLIFSSVLALSCITSAWAAKPVNLRHEPVTGLQSFFSANMASNPATMKSIRQSVDFNQTTHVRLQQTYAGYPVFGGEAIVHIPKGENTALTALATNKNTEMNGIIYQDLNKDLNNTPPFVFTQAQAEKALNQAISLYQQKTGLKQEALQTKTNLIVYLDKDNKAHWGFLTSFLVQSAKLAPVKPTYIIDAITLQAYKYWNNIQTLSDVQGGGFGGNDKMGKLIYDGLKKDYPALSMERNDKTSSCSLENKEVIVKDVRKNDAIEIFSCKKVDHKHNNLYWDAALDPVNGAFSPGNDALYDGMVIQSMYETWYGVSPLLKADNTPMVLTMRVHEDMENAYWDGEQMTFGDGGEIFYPLVSLGVGAHEISHGFTEQNSNLVYEGQSGGLNESFSDMAAQAAEFYSTAQGKNKREGGHNSWQLGSEIIKDSNPYGLTALRFMDEPTKDCAAGTSPGDWCSIDNVKDYTDDIDVHYTSGIFNKVFYLIGSAPNWNAAKAFDVMVQANQHYWTANTTFAEAACGVLKATADYKYDPRVVKRALAGVGLDSSEC